MARIRSIKPEFWDDRKLARSVSRDARMLYIGLWSQADEHARCNGDPHWIKGHVFPYDDDLTDDVIDSLLHSLVTARRVVAYEVDGDPYLFLPKLAQHQRLETKVESRLPPPPEPGSDESAPHVETTTHSPDEPAPHADEPAPHAGEAAPDADEPAPDPDDPALARALQVAGSREQVAGSRGRAARDKRASRLPDGFDLAGTRAEAAAKHGMSPDVAVREFAKFTAWHGSKGSRHVDWDRAWLTWVLRWKEDRGPNARAPTQPEGSRYLANLKAVSDDLPLEDAR
jgi:hypothetical protein